MIFAHVVITYIFFGGGTPMTWETSTNSRTRFAQGPPGAGLGHIGPPAPSVPQMLRPAVGEPRWPISMGKMMIHPG